MPKSFRQRATMVRKHALVLAPAFSQAFMIFILGILFLLGVNHLLCVRSHGESNSLFHLPKRRRIWTKKIERKKTIVTPRPCHLSGGPGRSWLEKGAIEPDHPLWNHLWKEASPTPLHLRCNKHFANVCWAWEQQHQMRGRRFSKVWAWNLNLRCTHCQCWRAGMVQDASDAVWTKSSLQSKIIMFQSKCKSISPRHERCQAPSNQCLLGIQARSCEGLILVCKPAETWNGCATGLFDIYIMHACLP